MLACVAGFLFSNGKRNAVGLVQALGEKNELGGIAEQEDEGEGKAEEEEKAGAEEEDEEESQSPMVRCDALMNAVSLSIRKHGVCLRFLF